MAKKARKAAKKVAKKRSSKKLTRREFVADKPKQVSKKKRRVAFIDKLRNVFVKNKKGADQISKFKEQLNKQNKKELIQHRKFIDQKYKAASTDFMSRKAEMEALLEVLSSASGNHTSAVIDALEIARSPEEAEYVFATVKGKAASKRREIKKGLKVKAKLAKLAAKSAKKTKQQKMQMWMNAEVDYQAKKKKIIQERLKAKKNK